MVAQKTSLPQDHIVSLAVSHAEFACVAASASLRGTLPQLAASMIMTRCHGRPRVMSSMHHCAVTRYRYDQGVPLAVINSTTADGSRADLDRSTVALQIN